MDGQVGQSVDACGDVAGRAAGQPDDVAAGKNLLTVGRTDDAATPPVRVLVDVRELADDGSAPSGARWALAEPGRQLDAKWACT
jgi:hypothetical protein